MNANKFAFKNFVSQFENCVINVKSGALRLQVLKNPLTGYASQIVEHLTISDENFTVAMHLLTEEFLDQDCIINEIFGQIYHSKPLSEDYTCQTFFDEGKG